MLKKNGLLKHGLLRPKGKHLEGKNKFIGFWLFLGGETVLFASLFATYLALKDKVPSPEHALANDLFELPLVFATTMILLTSSLTSVYAMYHMKNFQFKKMMLWLGITVLLGGSFLALEIYEFNHYVHEFDHTLQAVHLVLPFIH